MAQVPVEEGLFTDGADGPRLRAARCGGCEELHFPAGDTCPFCGGQACRPEEIGAHGTLHVGTIVRNPPPGYAGPVPYGFGLVDTSEGLRVVSALEITEESELTPGRALRLVLRNVGCDEDGNDRMAWSYSPETPGTAP